MLDPRAASQLIARLRDQPGRHDPLAGLSAQERRILELIGEGLTNRQIGERMVLAEKTVKNYVSALFAKLGMHRRTQAAAYAVRAFGDHHHTGDGEPHLAGLGNTIRVVTRGQSGSDVVLVGESAEDLLPADPVVGDVDRFGPPGIGLGRGEPGRDQGCRRRPKTKYDVGTTPAELTSATTAAHIHFRPRIWLAGRRWMSMSAATRRAPSATAVVTSSMRVRSLRSLHRRLAATTSSSVRSPATCAAICSSASSSCLRTSAGKSSSCVTPVPLPSPASCAAICSSASSSCLRTSAGKSSLSVMTCPFSPWPPRLRS